MSENPRIISDAPDDLTYAIACEFINTDVKCKYCIEADKFYIYQDGYWKEIYHLELENLINKAVRISQYSINQKQNVLHQLKRLTLMRLEKFNCLDTLNLTNGMVNPYDGMLLEHHESYYSTLRIPYEYREEGTPELWIKSLNEIFEGNQEKVSLLQEFFGYCLIPDIKQKKALLLLGDSNSGKSTILNILRNMVGKENCSSVSLKFLEHQQYTPMLMNKLVNIDADVNKNAQDYEASFKLITGGQDEPLTCNQKFVAAFQFVPVCKMVMAANAFPKITDHSSAFYKRLLLIPCDRIFDDNEQNKNLSEELRKELPCILNWSIQGLQRLNKRGKFEHYNFMKEAVQELEDDNNPANLFFNEHVQIEFGTYIEKAFLFKKYQDWCKTNGQYDVSHIVFSKNLYKKFHKETPKSTRISNNGPTIWRNLKYIDDSKPPQQDIGWHDDKV